MSSRTVSAHKGTHTHDGWEVSPHLGWDGDGKTSITAACGLLSQYGYDGKGRRGQEGTWSYGSSNRREVNFFFQVYSIYSTINPTEGRTSLSISN